VARGFNPVIEVQCPRRSQRDHRKEDMARKKKITRKEFVKSPDEFITLSSRAVNFILAHKHQAKFFGMAIVIIVIAFVAGNLYLRHINNKGQDAFNTACYFLADNMKPDAGTEDLKKAAELFETVTDKYSLSNAAKLAYPQIAYLKFLEKEYDEAIGLYQRFLDKISGDTKYLEFKSLTNLALAACYEAKGDLKRAIDQLKPVVVATGDPFRELAMLNLERLYRLDNQHQKAGTIVQEFVEEYKDSPFFPMAKARFLSYGGGKGGSGGTD
jgi:tetratricopeptide (TPR) repeat protein